MTTIQRISFAAAIAILLAACASEEGETESSEAPPVEETAFGDMVGAMDKARAVEDTTQQHKESLDRAIDASEGADER